MSVQDRLDLEGPPSSSVASPVRKLSAHKKMSSSSSLPSDTQSATAFKHTQDLDVSLPADAADDESYELMDSDEDNFIVDAPTKINEDPPVKHETLATRPWWWKFDWTKWGYRVYLFGSLLYLAESLAPFSNGFISDESGLWLDIVASSIFIVESSMYVVAWGVHHQLLVEMKLPYIPYYRDWNLQGNLLFCVGSYGYVYTSVIYKDGCCEEVYNIVMLVLAAFFLIDALLYLAGAGMGYKALAPRPAETDGKPDIRLGCLGNFDLYLVATWLYIIGSLLYVNNACMPYLAQAGIWDPSEEVGIWFDLATSTLFLVDSIFYMLSIIQSKRLKKWRKLNQRDYEKSIGSGRLSGFPSGLGIDRLNDANTGRLSLYSFSANGDVFALPLDEST